MLIAIMGMKMGRIVIIPIHLNHDAEEAGYLRHKLAPSSHQERAFQAYLA